MQFTIDIWQAEENKQANKQLRVVAFARTSTRNQKYPNRKERIIMLTNWYDMDGSIILQKPPSVDPVLFNH